MIKFSASLARRFAFGLPLILCGLIAVSRADEQALKPHKNVQIGAVYGATASIKSIDSERNALELEWKSSGLHATKLFLSAATRYKIKEKEVAIGDVVVGDVLLDVRNRNPKGGESYFSAGSLTVKALAPLTLTIRGGNSWLVPPRESKPGETPTDLLIEDLQSDEIRGIGHYFPARGWLDEATGKWKDSDTLIVPAPEKMTFTRSIATAPLKISELSVGQTISFDANVRPDGELDGLTLWTIKEKSPQP